MGNPAMWYYYLRDKQNRPLVTVCLLKDNDSKVYQGVAICSLKDNPNKKTGKAIAFGRAKQAEENKKDDGSIFRQEAYETLSKVNDFNFYLFKSTYDPVLTQYEAKLLNRRN